VDRQIDNTDAATFTLSHAFSDTLSVHNQTRWQQVTQLSVVDQPQGTFCLANDTSPGNTGITACPAGYLPDQFQPNRSGTTRDTRNRLMATQTDLTASLRTGGIEHTLVAGFAITGESYRLANGSSERSAGGALPNPALPRTTISNPDYRGYTGPINFIVASTTQGNLDNQALYVFDDVQFSEHWSFNGGVRVESNSDHFAVVSYATPATGGAATPAVPGSVENNLFSYRAGLVYKPTTRSSIYLAYGNSETPSVSSVNGTCTVSGTNSNCNLDPEKARNLELGTKWDLLDSRLSLTAAVSRNERTNYRVNEGITPENPTGQQVLDGNARVDAVLLGVSGRILPNWSVYANYTHLDSQVLQGVADSIAAAGQDYTRGDPLQNTPAHSASLWSTWDAMRSLQLGYGLTYSSRIYVLQHTAPTGAFPAGGALPTAGGYVVHRAMASYSVNRAFQLQLNVNNLFDKQYLTRVRTQRLGWGTPGEARSIVLSANLSF
jgi:catecholate siderophore receptor